MTDPGRLGMLNDRGVPCRSDGRLSCVYSLTNIITGTRYIGSTVNLSQRWATHRAFFRRGRWCVNERIADDLEAFGVGAFAVDLIESVEPNNDALSMAERRWIEHYAKKEGGIYNIIMSGHREMLKRRRASAPQSEGE